MLEELYLKSVWSGVQFQIILPRWEVLAADRASALGGLYSHGTLGS
jgi:hypothetical protein